jgi:hypothetical protein
MKRFILPFLLPAFLLTACSPAAEEYRIHGIVYHDGLEGVRIFLVPLHDQRAAVVDSVEIRNRRFAFRGHRHGMAVIRLHRAHRYGYQDLLVVTEPGDIHVVVDTVSHGGGTPQNDSLQAWKELTAEYHRASRRLGRAAQEAMAHGDTLSVGIYRHRLDAVRRAYVASTHRLAAALGEGILHDFLLQRCPLPEE